MSYHRPIVSRRRSSVTQGDRTTAVTNLGWLLRNWKKVVYFEVETEGYGARLVAHLVGGGSYQTMFASAGVLKDWLHRPVFRGVRVVWDGHETVA